MLVLSATSKRRLADTSKQMHKQSLKAIRQLTKSSSRRNGDLTLPMEKHRSRTEDDARCQRSDEESTSDPFFRLGDLSLYPEM